MGRLWVAALSLVMLGCAAPLPTTSPSPTAAPTITPNASQGGFDCQLPVTVPAAGPDPTHLTDLQISGEPGFDRIVWEFDGGSPEIELRQGSPPFTIDPAGELLPVDGNVFLLITFRGASRGGSDGPVTYEGATDFDTQLPELWQVRMAGDFEGVMTFVLGLIDPPCYKLSTPEGPTRVVLDLADQ